MNKIYLWKKEDGIMCKKSFNEKYRIAVYKLSDNCVESLVNYLDSSEYYCNEIFEIIELKSLKNDTNDLTEKPDILLIDVSEELTDEIRKYSEKNFAQIVRVTNTPIQYINSSDIVLSLSHEVMKEVNLFTNDNRIVMQIEFSFGILKDLAQIANTSKLQHISKKILEEIKKDVMFRNKKQLFQVLIKLNYFIDLKDEYTKRHSENVSDYVVLLGKELNLPKKQLELIRLGGKLHDIGKVGIPDSILKKSGPLSSQEFEIMKRHTLIGDAILCDDSYKEIKQMIRSHHERMDGKGYPDGLKGKEIPYFARMLSVVDAFDAMTTQRTYNKRKTLDEAFCELRRASRIEIDSNGEMRQQLDPDLVDIFIQAFEKNPVLMKKFELSDIEIINFRSYQDSLNDSIERGL